MKKRVRKDIDELLNGDLDAEERERAARAVERAGAGEELEGDRALLASLGLLPVEEPSRDLAASIRQALAHPEAAPPPATGLSTAAKAAVAAGMGAVVAAAVIGAVIWSSKSPPPEEEPRPAAVESTCLVARLEGTVFKSAKGTGVPARIGMTLTESEGIRTGFDGRAELEIDPGARAFLFGETNASVEQLQGGSRALSLSSGRLTLDTKTPQELANVVRAGMLAATIESGDTSMAVLAPKEGKAVVGLRSGSALVAVPSGKIALEAGTCVKFTGGKPGPMLPLPENVLLEVKAHRLRAGRILLSGATDSHARVWVDRVRIPVDEAGRFLLEYDAKPGETIEVLAEDFLGNTEKIRLEPRSAKPPEPVPGEAPKTKRYEITW